MMEAAPASPFEVTKANLLFEFVVVALNTPAQFGGVDKLTERCCDVRTQIGIGAIAGIHQRRPGRTCPAQLLKCERRLGFEARNPFDYAATIS
jgi:hypothetical protein